MNRTVLVALGMMTSAMATADVSCHIHPPGSTPLYPVGIIGPYESPLSCERELATRFAGAGRCHCAADFSPRWLPPIVVPKPGDSPLG